MYGLKDIYDFAFSIGGACACSQSLRRAGMQYASFPFDWAGFPSVPGKARMLAGGFKDIMPLEEMKYAGPNTQKNKDIYYNERTGMLFLHDFPKGVPIAEVIDEVREKYRRRAERFDGLMRSSRNVLAVYTTIPNEDRLPDADFVEARRIIGEKYPDADIDFLVFSQAAGIEFSEAAISNPEAHVFRVDCDYQSKIPGNENIGDEKIIAPILKKVIQGVRDYRTPEEIRKYREVKRRKEFAAYHAANAYEYVVNKAYYKLFRHFQNRLERKGFSFG